MLDAFAEGVTDYMIEVRNGTRPKHPLFTTTNLPLDEDWTARDSLGLWMRMGSDFRKIEWDEGSRRFQIDACMHQLVLQCLELSDGAAECLALLGVVECEAVRAAPGLMLRR